MFSYFGSKSKIVHRYPRPRHKIVIEPFAGSARYALRYPSNWCWLNDTYEPITSIWRWVIQATTEDIEGLPDLRRGDDLRQIDLADPVRHLLGFSVNRGCVAPRNIMTAWPARDGEIRKLRKRLHDHCGLIRHWHITGMDYRKLPNIEATWFIDPPYQHGGEHYPKNQIDYQELAKWCRARKGQVIVCETTKSNWLPFRPLCDQRGQAKRTTEAIWTNEE